MSSLVFLVGKSDPQQQTIAAIRKLGYKVGIFQDAAVTLKRPEAYDKIITLNFSHIDEELPKITQDLPIAGVVCTYENYVTAKAKLGAYFGLPAISISSAEMSSDKHLMRRAFLNTDPTITPKFAKVSSEKELLEFAANISYPLILKPTNLVKSLLVLRCNDREELRENFAYASRNIGKLYKKYNVYDKTPQIIVEEFITGRSCSIAAFVDDAGVPHFCDGIVAITTATEHGVKDNYLYSRQLPLELDTELTTKLFNVADKGIRALKMRSTPAHVELMYDGDEVKIIEIGARIGGYRPRMYQYSYGTDLVEQEVKLALGEQPKLNGAFRAYSAVYELFPNREGAFQGLSGLEHSHPYTYLDIKPQPGQVIGPAKNGYKAAAVIIIVHQDQEIFRSLCESVDNLSIGVL